VIRSLKMTHQRLNSLMPYHPSSSYHTTSDYTWPNLTSTTLDSTAKSNNGTSLPVKAHTRSSIRLSIVLKIHQVNTVLFHQLKKKNVSSSMRTVTTPDKTQESVKIHHSQILTTKSNPLRWSTQDMFIFITCLVSMVKMLSSVLPSNV